jgi:hypothetical protein
LFSPASPLSRWYRISPARFPMSKWYRISPAPFPMSKWFRIFLAPFPMSRWYRISPAPSPMSRWSLVSSAPVHCRGSQAILIRHGSKDRHVVAVLQSRIIACDDARDTFRCSRVFYGREIPSVVLKYVSDSQFFLNTAYILLACSMITRYIFL